MSDEQQPLHALPQGHRLQEYELVRVLGFGGFGMTYLGFDHNLDKAVAIKEYLPSDIATRTADRSVAPQASEFRDDFQWGLERFLDEARTLARFDHRHIIKVHRFFEAHGTAYIVMEYAEGETLSAFLERKGTLSEDELRGILYPILDGLEVVHGADFLHRDIKPGNIVLRDVDGSPVLLDFGAARQAIGAKSRSVTSIVTPGYAPIEQYSSRDRQGPWTDIYALGGVCYRALTGRVPDNATDRTQDDPLVPIEQLCEGQVSAAMLKAIDKALSVKEADRPQSISAWHQMLTVESGEVQSSENVQSPTEPASEPRQKAADRPHNRPARSSLVFIVAVALLAVGGFGIVVQKQRQELDEQRQKLNEQHARIDELENGAPRQLALAQAKLEEGSLDAAIGHVEKLLAIHPHSAEAEKARHIQDQIGKIRAKAEEDRQRAAEEAERKKRIEKEEKQRKEKAALAKLRKTRDDMEGITWYNHPTTMYRYGSAREDSLGAAGGIYVYFGRRDKGDPWLRAKAYVGFYLSGRSSWIFVRNFFVVADGERYDKSYCTFERDTNYGYREWYDWSPNRDDIKMLMAIARAQSAKIRFVGEKYNEDRTFGSSQKKAIAEVLTAFEGIGGRLP